MHKYPAGLHVHQRKTAQPRNQFVPVRGREHLGERVVIARCGNPAGQRYQVQIMIAKHSNRTITQAPHIAQDLQ